MAPESDPFATDAVAGVPLKTSTVPSAARIVHSRAITFAPLVRAMRAYKGLVQDRCLAKP